MTKEKQIIAIAKLDGYKFSQASDGEFQCWKDEECVGKDWIDWPTSMFRKYLTSRDAIIPVIEKQSKQVKVDMETILLLKLNVDCPFLSTVEQLAEALLRATGKWEE